MLLAGARVVKDNIGLSVRCKGFERDSRLLLVCARVVSDNLEFGWYIQGF